MTSIRQLVTRKLKLKVNEEKSAVARPGERKFLAFSFTWRREPQRRIAPKAIARFKQRDRWKVFQKLQIVELKLLCVC